MGKGGSIVTCCPHICSSFRVLDGDLPSRPSRNNGSLQSMFPFQNHFPHLPKHWLSITKQHWQSNGVSTSANATQLTKYVLKSAWCTCPSPQIKLRVFITSTVHKEQSMLKKLPKMALFLHMTKWFYKTGSRLCHMRCLALVSGNILLFLLFWLYWPLSQLE